MALAKNAKHAKGNFAYFAPFALKSPLSFPKTSSHGVGVAFGSGVSVGVGMPSVPGPYWKMACHGW